MRESRPRIKALAPYSSAGELRFTAHTEAATAILLLGRTSSSVRPNVIFGTRKPPGAPRVLAVLGKLDLSTQLSLSHGLPAPIILAAGTPMFEVAGIFVATEYPCFLYR
jgi:hypothetical protein